MKKTIKNQHKTLIKNKDGEINHCLNCTHLKIVKEERGETSGVYECRKYYNTVTYNHRQVLWSKCGDCILIDAASQAFQLF